MWLITLLVTVAVATIAYVKWTYQYWKRRNFQHLEPTSIFGNFASPAAAKEHPGVALKSLYDTMKAKGWKHGGIYGLLSPVYVVVDLDYLKNIMTKDFQYFSDRGTYHNEKADPLSAHLFHLRGTKWRNLRTKFTPTFTSGKMKMMFQTLLDCEVNMKKQIARQAERKEPIDIKDVLGCFTTDIIGSCAFGLNCKTFEEENSPFRLHGKKVFEKSFTDELKRSLAGTFPRLSLLFNLSIHSQDTIEFFLKIVRETVEYREKNNITRKDFLQMLIDMKNNKLAEDEGYNGDGKSLTIEEITAQSFVFFIAGFETSSTTMTFALYELAKNQDIQERAREEVLKVLEKHNGELSYDALQEMKYMGQVIDEALRKHPPAALVPRRCTKEYKVPGTDFVMEKNTTVLIPIYAIHHDEEYYPEPEKFDPERFSEENKNKRHPYAHIPFGEGPRICIGMRFGLMQSKVGLASLLRNFKFTLNSKTKEPLKMKPHSTVLAAEGEVWLNAEKID